MTTEAEKEEQGQRQAVPRIDDNDDGSGEPSTTIETLQQVERGNDEETSTTAGTTPGGIEAPAGDPSSSTTTVDTSKNDDMKKKRQQDQRQKGLEKFMMSPAVSLSNSPPNQGLKDKISVARIRTAGPPPLMNSPNQQQQKHHQQQQEQQKQQPAKMMTRRWMTMMHDNGSATTKQQQQQRKSISGSSSGGGRSSEFLVCDMDDTSSLTASSLGAGSSNNNNNIGALPRSLVGHEIGVPSSSSSVAAHDDDSDALGTGAPRLIGREEELRQLNDLLEGVFGHRQQQQQQRQQQQQQKQSSEHHADDEKRRPTVAFVHGKSGVGKTALVDTCLNAWRDRYVVTMTAESQQQPSSASEQVGGKESATATAATATGGYGGNVVDSTSGGGTGCGDRIWITRGKYEQFTGPSQPYSALLEALDSIGRQVIEASSMPMAMTAALPATTGGVPTPAVTVKKREEYCFLMRRALQYEGNILVKLIPSFQWFDSQDSNDTRQSLSSFGYNDVDGSSQKKQSRIDDNVDMTLASERLAVALLTFLKYFCTNIGPLVMVRVERRKDCKSRGVSFLMLHEIRTPFFNSNFVVGCLFMFKHTHTHTQFLDDLQWADEHSIILMMNLVGREESSVDGSVSGSMGASSAVPVVPNFVLLTGHRDEEGGTHSTSSGHVATPQSQLEQQLMKRAQAIDVHVRDLDVTRVEQLLRAILQVRDLESFQEGTNEEDDDSPCNSSETKKNDVRALANLVHNKTFGNPYFVLQQLEYLHSQNLLMYNFETLKWEWDLASVRLGTDSSSNVVDVVTSRVASVPFRVKRLLQLASCLGFFVELDVLEFLEQKMIDNELNASISVASSPPVSGAAPFPQALQNQIFTQQNNEILLPPPPPLDVAPAAGAFASSIIAQGRRQAHASDMFREALARAEEEAFIECSGKIMKFSHDRIQQCVYDLLMETTNSPSRGFLSSPLLFTQNGPVSAKDVVHYQIGMSLQDQFEATKDERFLFLAVEQIDRVSSDFIVTRLPPEEIYGFIELNHQASRLAKKKGEMQSVAAFLSKAISLTQPLSWRFHYHTMLELYNSSAEVEFGLGRIDTASERVATILHNAVREVDRVRAMVVQFQMYGQQRQFVKAIAEGRAIVKLLGEPLPNTGLINIMREYMAVKKATKKKTNAFFVELSETKRSDIRTILKVLQISSVYGWNGDPLYSGLAFLRAMRITVREGSDVTTPFVYSGYAYMLGLFGDEKEAIRFGQIALDKQKNEGKATFPSSCTLTYGSVMHLQLPIAVALEPLISSYRVGLETGDLFFGTINISVYALVYFSCGLPLAPLASDMTNYMTQLQICKQDVPLAFILPTTQLALNLMGQSEDASDLSRESIKRTQADHFSENVLLDSRDASVLYMMYLEVFALFILDAGIIKLETAMRAIYRLPETRLGGAHIMNYFFVFVDGLVGFRLDREAQKEKPLNWRKTRRFANRLAKQSMKVLRQWGKTRPVNSISLLNLLDAEQQSRNKKMSLEAAKRMYNLAISQFARSGIIHYGAVANELAGLYMLEMGDLFWAKHYLSQACSLYAEWNAVEKAKRMCESHEFIDFQPTQFSLPRFAVHGRSRFNVVRDSLRRDSSTSMKLTAAAEALPGSVRSMAKDDSISSGKSNTVSGVS